MYGKLEKVKNGNVFTTKLVYICRENESEKRSFSQ